MLFCVKETPLRFVRFLCKHQPEVVSIKISERSSIRKDTSHAGLNSEGGERGDRPPTLTEKR